MMLGFLICFALIVIVAAWYMYGRESLVLSRSQAVVRLPSSYIADMNRPHFEPFTAVQGGRLVDMGDVELAGNVWSGR